MLIIVMMFMATDTHGYRREKFFVISRQITAVVAKTKTFLSIDHRRILLTSETSNVHRQSTDGYRCRFEGKKKKRVFQKF
jgi:hypothetical protein